MSALLYESYLNQLGINFRFHHYFRPSPFFSFFLQALQDSRHYGELLEFQDYQKKLLSTQLAALEELMGEAQAVL